MPSFSTATCAPEPKQHMEPLQCIFLVRDAGAFTAAQLSSIAFKVGKEVKAFASATCMPIMLPNLKHGSTKITTSSLRGRASISLREVFPSAAGQRQVLPGAVQLCTAEVYSIGCAHWLPS